MNHHLHLILACAAEDRRAVLRDPVSRVSARLAEAIKASGLSKKAVAFAVGVFPSALSRWLRGGDTPNARHLAALAKVLGVSVDWLCTGHGKN